MEYIIFIIFAVIYLGIGVLHAVVIFNLDDEGISSTFGTFITLLWPIIWIVCVFLIPIIIAIKYLKEV